MSDKTGNELIAEFMGFEKTGTFYETSGMRYDKYASEHFGYTYPAQWAFDSKWDWLMPVVAKIADLERTPPPNYTGYRIEIVPNGYVKVSGFGFTMQSITSNVSIEGGLIEAVYKAVVEFITWYNKQNP